MKTKFRNSIIITFLISFSVMALNSCSQQQKWLKGNMHTHTFYSDGNDFPENVAAWYKEKGYDFLVFTDHNILHQRIFTGSLRKNQVLENGNLWQRVDADNPALMKYLNAFGEEWVESLPDTSEGILRVRLKTFDEYRSLFEEIGKFLLIMGNEITNPQVHFLVFHQDKLIPATKGNAGDKERMIRETNENLRKYREESGREVYPVLAHPNHRWSITAEMMLAEPELRFFEVYNGIPGTMYQGDGYRAGTERMWDIVLANRLEKEGGELLYGLATDDAHSYHGEGSGPGRGWVMVEASVLSPESILETIDKGDFYASTGVTLKKIRFNGKTLKIEIEGRDGVEYVTEYIGTFRGFDPSSTATLDSLGVEIPNTTRTYSSDIGQVLHSSNELKSSYKFTGQELYVRVKITSTADQVDPVNGKNLGKQMAWVQPHVMDE